MIDDYLQNLLHILKNFEFPNRTVEYYPVGEVKIYFGNFLYDKHFKSFYSFGSIQLFNMITDMFLSLDIYSFELDEIISDYDNKTLLLCPDEFINIGLFKLNDKDLLKI